MALLAAASPGDPDNPVAWAGYAALAPHVLATGPLGDHSPAGRRLVLDTIRYLQARGHSHASSAIAEPLLDRWRSILGPNHPDPLTAASMITVARFALGETDSARTLGEDTLQRCRQVLGPDHPTTLWAAAALTLALAQLGEADPARALAQDTLQRCRRVLGPDHVNCLWAAATLALAQARVGDAEKARALAQDTLQRGRRALSPYDPIALYLTEVASGGHPMPGGDAPADRPNRPV